MNSKQFQKLSVVLSGSLVLLVGCAPTDPDRPVISAAKETAGYVGNAVSGTVKGVGNTIEGASDRITGNIDPVAARAEVDKNAEGGLERLLKLNRKAKALFDISYGYAVFDSRKTSFLVTVGGGSGVAVRKSDGKKTYMRMFTGGANVGAGIQFFQNIFLFETKSAYDAFVNSGWEAGTSANANFGRDSIDAQIKFSNGMAFFQLSENGINLSADITGTKYWKDGDLN